MSFIHETKIIFLLSHILLIYKEITEQAIAIGYSLLHNIIYNIAT